MRVPLSVLLLALGALASGATAAGTRLPVGDDTGGAAARAAHTGAPADTLRFSVVAGEPLLVTLPARVGNRAVTYSLLSAPALSWLVDRSFYWRTLPDEGGVMPVVIRRRAAGAEADTLVLSVEVAPR